MKNPVEDSANIMFGKRRANDPGLPAHLKEDNKN